MIRVQIQNHDIATPADTGCSFLLHPTPKDLEFLPKGGRKKRMQRAVFRIQSELRKENVPSRQQQCLVGLSAILDSDHQF
jgi:hypothetical protein